MNDLKIAYFGGEPLGVPTLEELEACGITPSLIVCNPDRPSGRGQRMALPPVKDWALERNIEVWQPTDFTDQALVTEKLREYDLFVVVAYNQILPKWLIELPQYKTLNLHPSLLPKLRGASPIRTAILEDRRAEIGVSIMLMDEKMDHGPILAQELMIIADENWPLSGNKLDVTLSRQGGALMAATIPEWVAGSIKPTEQAHSEATYTHKFSKDIGQLKFDPHNLPSGDTAKQMLQKIKAFEGFPGTYFFYNEKRVKLKDARLDSDTTLRPLTVVPEGKPAIDFETWLARLTQS